MAAPKAPENFIVIRDESRVNAVLRWDKVTQDVNGSAVTVNTYKIYKADTADSRYLTLEKTVTATAGATQLTTLDSLDPDIMYYFTVLAHSNAEGDSAQTDPATDF